MSSLPLISVIVPVYNTEKYLNRCIESIVNQTYKNLEIILVDDGSPDNCPQMCDEWAYKDKRIKVIHKENGGVSSARNAGIEIAKGDYIGFVDSDDIILPDMYSVLEHSIVNNCSDMSVIGYIINDNCLRNEKEVVNSDLSKIYMFDDVNHKSFNGFICNKLYHYKVILKNNIRFNERINVCEDTVFNFNYLECINLVSIESYCGYIYETRLDSAAHSGKFLHDSQVYNVTKYLLDNSDGDVKNQILVWAMKFWIGKIDSVIINKYDLIEAKEIRVIIKDNLGEILKNNQISLVNKIESFFISYFFNIFKMYVKIINN